jgi:hypothetical protein
MATYFRASLDPHYKQELDRRKPVNDIESALDHAFSILDIANSAFACAQIEMREQADLSGVNFRKHSAKTAISETRLLLLPGRG